MTPFARSDDSLLARWWWTVDRWMIVAVALLIGVGMIMTLAASIPVAERLGLGSFHFAKRQAVFLIVAICGMIAMSLASVRGVRRVSVMALPIFLLLTAATLVLGPEIKGATRWLAIGSFTLQPSEFLKPALIVFIAWMLSEQFREPHFPGRIIAGVAFLLTVSLLVLQPDFGQAFLLSVIVFLQLVIAGLPILWIVSWAGLGITSASVAYLTVPHVASRIDRFMDPSSGDTYQVDNALNAFRSGGLFGRGPGEGAFKRHLPDAHTDYIFAVAGEEYGALACLGILALFAAIAVRGLSYLTEEDDPFVMLAGAGLLLLFGLQALINIGVNLAVIPSKGMTLPFISYGGSSMLALAFGMGMILALTRHNRFLQQKRRRAGGRK